MKSITYKDSGVNIDEGNKAVDLIKKKVKSTYDNNVIGDLGSFGAIYSIKNFMSMKEPVLVSSTDGVGTKLKIANLLKRHETIGIDLVAMCVNDVLCQGAMPLFFLDYIATGKLSAEKMDIIISGIVEGCKQSECALIGGEMAEMPGMYNHEDYDLAGFTVGICDKEKILKVENVKENQILIGLSSSGIHSNGYSLIRKILKETNSSFEDKIDSTQKTLGDYLIEPTRIYVKDIKKLMNFVEIKGIAHITGGGMLENIPRMLPEGLKATIELESWKKPEIFNWIENLKIIETNELYRSFNMGIGLVIIIDEKDLKESLNILNEKEIQAFEIGRIAKGQGVTLCQKK